MHDCTEPWTPEAAGRELGRLRRASLPLIVPLPAGVIANVIRVSHDDLMTIELLENGELHVEIPGRRTRVEFSPEQLEALHAIIDHGCPGERWTSRARQADHG